ncbi:MAG: DUF3450 domain-containing protein [Fibrobacterales bacterium]
MKQRTITIPATIFALLLCLNIQIFANSADAIDSLETIKESLAKDIKELKLKIDQTDSLSRMEESRFALLKKRHTDDVVRRTSELEAIQKELTGVQAAIQKEVQQQQSLEVRIKNSKAYAEFLTKKLATLAGNVESLIERSLPEKKNVRLERIAVLKRDLESGNATPEEGFGRLKSILSEEIRFGDEVVVTTTSVVRKDGEVANVKMLRIGNQWMVYVDEDEKLYGVLKREMKDGVLSYVWIEDLNFSEREMVRNAIDVKLAKKAPEIVSLPLSLSLTSEVK